MSPSSSFLRSLDLFCRLSRLWKNGQTVSAFILTHPQHERAAGERGRDNALDVDLADDPVDRVLAWLVIGVDETIRIAVEIFGCCDGRS